jgi:AAHS family cis,cis-muconate transporter-like MFS transporter
MLKEGLRKQLDLLAPFRAYPRESVVASLVYFFYLFTWVGWSAWMPFYLANERHLGFPTMASYLSAWMFCAIFAYWICGWLCDVFGRRWVIPAFAVPAAVLLVVMGQLESPAALFWVGLATNFLITGSFGTGLGYTAEIFPTQIRGTAVGATFAIGLGFASLAPMIMGWIATEYSIAAGLPLLALSFLLLGPLFFMFAPDVTRKELADFVGQRVG